MPQFVSARERLGHRDGEAQSAAFPNPRPRVPKPWAFQSTGSIPSREAIFFPGVLGWPSGEELFFFFFFFPPDGSLGGRRFQDENLFGGCTCGQGLRFLAPMLPELAEGLVSERFLAGLLVSFLAWNRRLSRLGLAPGPPTWQTMFQMGGSIFVDGRVNGLFLKTQQQKHAWISFVKKKNEAPTNSEAPRCHCFFSKDSEAPIAM